MAQVNVGITDNGLVVLTVTDDDTGEATVVPMHPPHAMQLSIGLRQAAERVNRAPAPAIILPHPAILKR